MTDLISHIGYLNTRSHNHNKSFHLLYNAYLKNSIIKKERGDHFGVSHFSKNGASSRSFFWRSAFHATAPTIPMK